MGVNIQTIKDIRFYLSRELSGMFQEPEISALTNIIIKTLLNVTKLHQVYVNDEKVSIIQAERCIEICNELKTGKPLQYILGETIFYDYLIRVTSATLIPRPETEELVHHIIRENKGFKGNIIDFGTGSGCIAIALAGNLPGSIVTGIDISEEALQVARKNAALNKVLVSFQKGDILNFDQSSVPMSEIIVSNPPYVRDSEKKLMSRNVLDFEPPQALFVSDSDPLVFYKAVIKTADNILLPKGDLWFEINEALGYQVAELIKSFGYFNIRVIKDINGKDRIIKGSKNG